MTRILAADQDAVFVVELPEGTQADEVTQMGERLHRTLPHATILLAAPGTRVRVLPTGGVYHHERLGDYEVEILARTEEELRQRLQLVTTPGVTGKN